MNNIAHNIGKMNIFFRQKEQLLLPLHCLYVKDIIKKTAYDA